MKVLYFGGVPLSILYGKYHALSDLIFIFRHFYEAPILDVHVALHDG